MGPRSKTLIVVLLATAAIGVFSFQSNNSALFKGQIFDEPEDSQQSGPLPDLRAQLSYNPPSQEGDDLEAVVTIENIGQGEVSGDQQFSYKIFINDVEVFTNTDSFTTILPGDSFSFIYPIPQLIYQYPNQGKVKATVDLEDQVPETNEDNNSTEIEYSY